MNNKFIPAFHFVPANEKLTSSWAMQAVNAVYFNSNNINLLDKKNIEEIEQYSVGDFDLTPFKEKFKSLKKQIDDRKKNPGNFFNNLNDTTGIDWTCYPAIPTKLNSAVNIVQKIPMEFRCVAQDGLAMKKKKEDLAFLKNKPIVEKGLQELADQLGVGKVDLGGSKNSSVEYKENPLGLDLNAPDEEEVFMKLMYSLKVEAAFEKIMKQIYEYKNVEQIKYLEIKDQYKFGVSAHRAMTSSMTGLPDIQYIFPGNISAPESALLDMADHTHRIINEECTVLDLYNLFSDEIGSDGELERIINGRDKFTGKGYCACNNMTSVDAKNFGTFKINLKYMEVKSVDWVGIQSKEKSKKGFTSLTDNPEKATDKIWGQNTYAFWWLTNTKYCFGIHRLDFSHRTKGQEAYQGFSSNIQRTQKKSPVELCIGENKKAQVAEIKLQHTIIMSMPNGKYIDLRFLRSALTGLKAENNQWTQQDLLNLAFEKNIMIGDTQGFEGANDSQFKPFIDIPGGLKAEAGGYMTVLQEANSNISKFTGINEQLTGQSANPEGLVGMQKLLINQSINALHHVNEAIGKQYQKLMNIWGVLVQDAIKRGGKTKKFIENLIGSDNVNLLEGLNDIPLHNLTIMVDVTQREEERANYEREVYRLKSLGVLTATDDYILSGVNNPRERFALLTIREKKFKKEQEQIRAEGFQNAQAIKQQEGQNQMAAVQGKNEGDIKKIYAKGEVEAQVVQLKGQTGMNTEQFRAMVNKALQQDRNSGQTQKQIDVITTKHNLENQTAL